MDTRVIKFVLKADVLGEPIAFAIHKFQVEVDSQHDPLLLPRLLNYVEEALLIKCRTEDEALRAED